MDSQQKIFSVLKMLSICLVLPSCVERDLFEPGYASRSVFEADKSSCLIVAARDADLADQQLERYEQASEGAMVGAALSAMLVGGQRSNRAFKRCMTAKGYKP